MQSTTFPHRVLSLPLFLYHSIHIPVSRSLSLDRGSPLFAVSADVYSADDVIAFKGRVDNGRDGMPTGCWGGAVAPLLTCRNAGLGSMFVWGVVTMILGTVISALKQAHYFDPKNSTNSSLGSSFRGMYGFDDLEQFGPYAG